MILEDIVKKNFSTFAILIFLISLFFFGVNVPRSFTEKEDIKFTIFTGDGIEQIGDRLEEEGIIIDSILFTTYAFLNNKHQSLQAGTYLLNSNMSISMVLDKIYKGIVVQERVTIIEGWRASEIANYLDGFNGLSGDIFLDIVASEPPKELAILYDKPKSRGLQGYLFPDTYFFNYGFSEEDLILAMLTNLDNRLLPEHREEIERRGKTIFEIITMASLIEEEVRSHQDKGMVSDILWRRIEIGMPLQVDATIAFITRKRTTRISIKETRIESPYNTYINRGLPVGPISNPGLKSILAAIYPIPNDYLFYLSKPTGETVFSRNFQEHIGAKNRYLR